MTRLTERNVLVIILSLILETVEFDGLLEDWRPYAAI